MPEALTETWRAIDAELGEHRRRGMEESLDYRKFYLYSLITHSTAIEGSTLTALETRILFDDGLTAKNKPLIHHLMNRDLKDAYLAAAARAEARAPVTADFLRELNALVMKSTGSAHNMPAGAFDSSRGEFRLCNVTAGYGGASYMNYAKIPGGVEALCGELRRGMAAVSETAAAARDVYDLSFDAHLNLVTIHPWVDGNGRTARLLMNYLQFYYRLFPAKVYVEDREDYIAALIASRKAGNAGPFRVFMAGQLLKSLREEHAGQPADDGSSGFVF